MPMNRQYCCGIRNGSPATSSVTTPPATNHNGRNSPLDGSARNPATGVATAASAPSSARFNRMRRFTGRRVKRCRGIVPTL